MESIKHIYRIGNGPSSSHTMGHKKAAEIFLSKHSDAAKFSVTLYGSLAATGKGHLTDKAILSVLAPVAPTEIVWHPDITLEYHPNGMLFEAFNADDCIVDKLTVYSIGGGALKYEGMPHSAKEEIYPLHTLTDILGWCKQTGRSYWEYVEEHEADDLWDYMFEVWKTMQAAVERGLDTEGMLPGGLKVRRKAPEYYIKAMG